MTGNEPRTKRAELANWLLGLSLKVSGRHVAWLTMRAAVRQGWEPGPGADAAEWRVYIHMVGEMVKACEDLGACKLERVRMPGCPPPDFARAPLPEELG